MSFVLETNAVSEIEKPRPNAGLVEWHDAQDAVRLFIATVTLAEVWHGFRRLYVAIQTTKALNDSLPTCRGNIAF